MPAAIRKIEKFFFIYLILSPLLDIYSGAYIHVASKIFGDQLSTLITPSLIIRMVVLLLFAYYVLSLRDKKSILTIIPIGVAWAMSVAGEILSGLPFSLFTDMQYMAKYVYNIAVLLVYCRLLERSSWQRQELLQWFNWYISLSALILSMSIHIPYMLGLGGTTYADRFGYFGAQGFFYAGNDITAVLMMLIPIGMVNYVQLAELTPGRRLTFAELLPNTPARRHHLFYLAAPGTALAALFAIGTKTAFIAFGVTIITFALYFRHGAKKSGDGAKWRAFRRVFFAFMIIFIFLSLFGLIKDLSALLGRLNQFRLEDPKLVTFVFSGREQKLKDAAGLLAAGGPMAWLFGIGRGTQRYIIEMDVFEVAIYYGLFGAVSMLWLYLKLGIRLIRDFVGHPDDYGLACFLAVGLTAGYLVMAGHVLFSVTSGFYFALILLYSRLYYAKSSDELKVL